jgi:hypothetical protein
MERNPRRNCKKLPIATGEEAGRILLQLQASTSAPGRQYLNARPGAAAVLTVVLCIKDSSSFSYNLDFIVELVSIEFSSMVPELSFLV